MVTTDRARESVRLLLLRRRRFWRAMVVTNVIAVVAIAVACLVMMRSQAGADWLATAWFDLKFGLCQGFGWPVEMFRHLHEVLGGGPLVAELSTAQRLQYAFFPYDPNCFTAFRMLGVAAASSACGYLCCWASGRGWGR